MSVLTITLPILPDRLEAWRRCRQELDGSRRARYRQSCQRLGISRVSTDLIETQLGAAVTYSIEARDVGKAISGLAESTMVFDCWLKEMLLDLHGVQLESTND